MTRSNRDAAADGELGGNVLEPIAATKIGPPWELSFVAGGGTGEIQTMHIAPRAPVDGEELGFNPVPGLVSSLLGEVIEETPPAYRWTPRAPAHAPVVPGQVGYLFSGVLAEAPAPIDMDGDTLTFLRRHTARPADPGPRCGLEFDGATCCLDKDHPSHEHAAVAPGASFVWRAIPGAPIVNVYDGRPGGPDSHQKLLDWMSQEISMAILGPTEKS